MRIHPFHNQPGKAGNTGVGTDFTPFPADLVDHDSMRPCQGATLPCFSSSVYEDQINLHTSLNDHMINYFISKIIVVRLAIICVKNLDYEDRLKSESQLENS